MAESHAITLPAVATILSTGVIHGEGPKENESTKSFWRSTIKFVIAGKEGTIDDECSGVLIGRRCAITAKHCLPKKDSQKMEATWGYLEEKKRSLKGYVEVDREQNVSHEKADLAVVRFKNDFAWTGLKPADLQDKRLTREESMEVVRARVIGFGNDVLEKTDSGKWRGKMSSFLALNQGFMNFDSSYQYTESDDGIEFKLQATNSGPETAVFTDRGDSGGPVFLNNRLHGIIMSGVRPGALPLPDSRHPYTHAISIPDYHRWLIEKLQHCE